jgi:hypothetical protein
MVALAYKNKNNLFLFTSAILTYIMIWFSIITFKSYIVVDSLILTTTRAKFSKHNDCDDFFYFKLKMRSVESITLRKNISYNKQKDNKQMVMIKTII